MRLPKSIPVKSTLDQIILNIDIAPTILDMAGVDIPKIMQGKSILPLFNADQEWRKSFLFTYWKDLIPSLPRILAARTDRYVYSTYPDIDDIDELYDLKNDPYETTNLIYSPEHEPVLKEMQHKLENLKVEVAYKKEVPRPNPEPEWGVNEGLLLDVDFNVSKISEINNKAKVVHGEIGLGIRGKALKFNNKTKVSFKWDKHLRPDLGSYVIEALVRPTSDGVIASNGSHYRGIMLYVDGGCPGVVTKESAHRLQFLDSQKSFMGEWVHIVAQLKNHHNKISLWVNGELISEEKVMWPMHDMHKGIGGIALGLDPTGKIDPKEISPLKFEGDMQFFRIYRQADVKSIINNARKYGLSLSTGKNRL
jgi:hypothetical protein